MKPYLILILSILLFSCAASDNREADSSSSAVTEETETASGSTLSFDELIIGTWHHTVTSTGCVSTIEYETTLNFSSSSLVNYRTGTYSIIDTSEPNKKEVQTLYETDNSLATCSGVSKNLTGFGLRYYFDFSEDKNTLYFYSSSDPEVIIVSYIKQS